MAETVTKQQSSPVEHREPEDGEATSGSLSPGLLAELRQGYAMSESDRACHNAVTNNAIDALALNREILKGSDGHFTHRIKSNGITNQKNSGRCWMFAALNALRPQVIRDHRMEGFEFSQAYLQFWDRLERANLFFESAIELRDADFLDREWATVNDLVLHEGGWWNFAASIIEKYGVVPQSVMPETHGSANGQVFNDVFGRLIRSRAIVMLRRHAEGAGKEELDVLKKEALKEVYRFLVINLGAPPTEFEWRYRQKKASAERESDVEMKSVEESGLTALERHTPQSFYQKYVGRPLSEFVCLYNDPKNDLNRHYVFKGARNVVGRECMNFVNVDMEAMKHIAASSILSNEPLWVAVNMHFDQSNEHGLMEHGLFDYEALFGIDLTISKADRSRFYAGVSNHAMTLMGVDLAEDGSPRKWLVENSWGDEKGEEGWWTIHDRWFDEHVYTIIVHKSHVPSAVLGCFEEDPVELPAWYPGAGGPKGVRSPMNDGQ